MIYAIFCLILLVIFVYYMFPYNETYQNKLINLIPGPPTKFFLMNMYEFQLSPSELWKRMRELGNEYYPIYKFRIFRTPYINIRHPDDMETILGNPKFTLKSDMYDPLVPWFGTGLLTSSGRKWQSRRKILTPSFHFNMLQQFVDIFVEESVRLKNSLMSEGGPVVKDLMYFYSEHTLNIICETAMGTSLKDKGPFQAKYRNAVYDMGKIIVYRLIRPWLSVNSVFKYLPQGWRQTKLLKILHGFSKEIIEERKDYHDKTKGQYLTGLNHDSSQTDSANDIGIRKRRLAMLDLLIATYHKSEIDDEGIREEVDTFMFRGHDTTAVCLCFTTMLLAEHKEIQARARAEANAVMSEANGKVTMATLQNLPYLERCIKESLRLYPSVPFISRRLEMDTKLSNYEVPANTVVHIHLTDVHRDPNYWPNPEVYDPDRFLPENMKGRHPYSYVPFSAGARNCIGQRFAMLELKSTLLFLLHNFYFEPVDCLKDISIDSDIVLRLTYPLRAKFIPIETSS